MNDNHQAEAEMNRAYYMLKCGIAAREQAIEILTEMGTHVKAIKPSFDNEHSLEVFDMIMQAFLLKTALADGKFINEEIAYIKAICNKGDILKQLEEATDGELCVTWPMLRKLDDQSCERLVSKLERDANEFVEVFVNPYARLDAALKGGYYERLRAAMIGMLKSLAQIDGESTVDEDFVALSSLAVFEDAWKSV